MLHKLSLILAIVFIIAPQASADDCNDFPEKLEKCEPYTCSFTHPFTQQSMERKIVGPEDGRCKYIEEMPNGGKMECRYPLNKLKEIAQFYKRTLTARETTSDFSIDLSTGRVKTGETIDGVKTTSNLLQECLNNGDCIISGYSNSGNRM